MSRGIFLAFLTIFCIKGVFLLADSQPAYFFGDSEAYLATATAAYVPPDRSVVYGLLLGKVALPAHSLNLMIAIQVFLSAMAACLLSFALQKIFLFRSWPAGLFGVLCAVEPLQLLSERYILTEACANFLFTIHFVLVLLYVKRGKLSTLLVAQAIGILLISFRISFLPLIFINSVLVPLLSPQAIEAFRMRKAGIRAGQVRLVAVHLLFSVVVSQGLLTVYKNRYGKWIGRDPAVFYNQGAFLVSDFAPLIEPEDFPVASKRDAIFSSLQYDRHDPLTRPKQHFVAGGLWPNILKQFPNEKQANDSATATAIHALLRQPFAAFRLECRTFIQYFDVRRLQEWLVVDEGGNGSVMSAQTRSWLQNLYGIADAEDYQMSLTKKWHQLVPAWYWVILCSLLLSPLLFLIRPKSEYPVLFISTIAAWLFFISATFTVDRPTPRFLTSAAWLILFLFALTLSGNHWRFSRKPVRKDSIIIQKSHIARSASQERGGSVVSKDQRVSKLHGP
jgi:hypothetical protein